jgi:hypothetical protein
MRHCRCKQRIRDGAKLVREQDLLCKADREDHKPNSDPPPRTVATRIERELRYQLIVTDDWAGDEVWIQQHEQSERPEGINRRLAAHTVDKVGNQLK